MLELRVQVGEARVAPHSAVPALDFPLHWEADQPVRSLALQARIHLEPTRREPLDRPLLERHSPAEIAWLRPLFGEPEQWSRSVSSLFWTQVNAQASGQQPLELRIPCSFDMSLAITRYLYGLEGGNVELRWSFSGSIFWDSPQGLQVSPIRPGLEARSLLAVKLWQELMQQHHGQQVCIPVSCEAFARLERYRDEHKIFDWDTLCDRLVGR